MEIGNEFSRKRLRQMMANPPAAAVLTGPKYSGKWEFLVEEIKQTDSPDILHVNGSMDGAREAIEFVKLSPVWGHVKTVLVDARGGMSDPAQDAYLKMCEETPPAAVIIIVAEDTGIMRPALVSRLDAVRWLPLSREEMREFVSTSGKLHDDTAVAISSGRPFVYESVLSSIDSLRELCMCINNMDLGKIPISSIPKAISEWTKADDGAKEAALLACEYAISSCSKRHVVTTILDFVDNLRRVPSANAEIHWWRACTQILG